MKGPCWRIYIAIFILIILVVVFPYKEGFDSYNKTFILSDYNVIDPSYNDTPANEHSTNSIFKYLTNTLLDNTFSKTDIPTS